MHAQGRSSLARLIAPLALIVFAVALVALVLGSGAIGGDDDTETAGTNDVPAATDERTTTERSRPRGPANYTIKANDTLSGIAAQHGTTVERLQTLNPELDPQGLVAGQRIKLRE